MTDRVKLACRVAVEIACEHSDDADVFEATLKLGSLEGTWAKVYDRREALYREHTANVIAAWGPVVAGLPVSLAVTRFRRSAGIEETVDRNRASISAKALAVAKWLVHQVFNDPTSPKFLTLVWKLADAIKTGIAEGEAGAIALAAQQVSIVGIDFDIAFRDAWKQLEKLGEYYADARGWLGRILNGAATDVGRLLARLAERNATHEDMVTEVTDLLGSNEIRSVSALVDMAMGQSFSRGALALYAREGIREVDFFTAGDSRVCPICDTDEKGSPYALIEAPQPPRHSFCRCVIVATQPLQALDFTPYLTIGDMP